MGTILSGDLKETITTQILEIAAQIRQKRGYAYDPLLLKEQLQMAIEGRFLNSSAKFLSPLSEGKELVILPQDGTSLLSEARDVFSHIDSDFTDWELNTRETATSATPVQVFKMSKDGTFKDLFLSLSPNLESLCLTQAQIKEFCKTHRTWLRTDGYGTFFLFKRGNEFFVAYVYVHSGGTLKVDVGQFEYSFVWSAEYRHRVVVPA